MRRSIAASALGATVAVALAAAPATSQQSVPDYKTLILKVGKQSVAGTLGPYSIPTADGKGESASPSFPLKGTGTLRVKRRDVVTLLFKAKPGNVAWRTARIDSRGREAITATGQALPTTKTKRRWKLTLPKGLKRSSDVLGFYIEYPNGFTTFEVGVKVR